MFPNVDSIYTSEKRGCDETGDGTKEKPFKTVKKGIRESLDKGDNVIVYCDAKPAAEGEVQQVIVRFSALEICVYYCQIT